MFIHNFHSVTTMMRTLDIIDALQASEESHAESYDANKVDPLK